MTGPTSELRDLWPLYALRLTTGDLELRYPTEAELPAFVDIIEAGIHLPTRCRSGSRGPTRRRQSATSRPTSGGWAAGALVRRRVVLTIGVWERGRAIGFQDLRAEHFPIHRRSRPARGSAWRTRAAGVGKLMRQAILTLAFDHLGAEVAETEAFLDNPASNRVSLAVGYEPNGFGRLAPRGAPRETQKFRMTLEGWRARPRPAIVVEGLEGALPVRAGPDLQPLAAG